MHACMCASVCTPLSCCVSLYCLRWVREGQAELATAQGSGCVSRKRESMTSMSPWRFLVFSPAVRIHRRLLSSSAAPTAVCLDTPHGRQTVIRLSRYDAVYSLISDIIEGDGLVQKGARSLLPSFFLSLTR